MGHGVPYWYVYRLHLPIIQHPGYGIGALHTRHNDLCRFSGMDSGMHRAAAVDKEVVCPLINQQMLLAGAGFSDDDVPVGRVGEVVGVRRPAPALWLFDSEGAVWFLAPARSSGSLVNGPCFPQCFFAPVSIHLVHQPLEERPEIQVYLLRVRRGVGALLNADPYPLEALVAFLERCDYIGHPLGAPK